MRVITRMDASESRNFFKLAFILLEIVLNHLTDVSKMEWDKRYPNNPWLDDNNSLQFFINQEKQNGTYKKNKLNIPSSGNRNDWDPTKLFFMLLYSSSINLPPACSLYKHVNKLRELRNKHFGHPANTSLSDQDFEAIYKDIETCMVGLNCSADTKQKMEDVKTGAIKLSDNDVRSLLQKMDDNWKHLKLITMLLLGVLAILIMTTTVGRRSVQNFDLFQGMQQRCDPNSKETDLNAMISHLQNNHIPYLENFVVYPEL